MASLSEGRTAVSLIAIDFSKAFNRMKHTECLEALARRGASTDSIKMVSAFLYKRKMRVRVGDALSTSKLVTGGAPQGTKMGNFLFTVTIEEIERKTSMLENSIPPRIVDDRVDEDELGLRRMAREMSVGPVARFNSGITSSTPYKIRSQKDALRYDDVSGRENESIQSCYGMYEASEPKGEAEWTDKFVDDITGGQELSLERAIVHITTGRERRLIHAKHNQALYDSVVQNSTEVGMKVNGSKTQLLCINPSNSCEAFSYINCEGKRITSGDNLKILGFVFGQTPDIREHLKHIKKKYCARAWSIRHLKGANLAEEKLVKIYCSLIRPVLEYASQVFYHMLNRSQMMELERYQMRVLKIIYGDSTSYKDALEKSGLATLEARMLTLVEKFTFKTADNKRYGDWFPKHEEYDYNLRKKLVYHKEFASTERQRNGPIFSMRRILNKKGI